MNDRDSRRTERRALGFEGRRWVLWALGMAATLICAGVALAYCGAVATIATTPAGLATRTFSPDNIIANYEWFRQQYRDIESFGVRIDLARNARNTFMLDVGARDTWSAEDRYRYAQLNDNLTGLQAQRARMIGTYNARTQMANRRLFAGADVPAFIEQPATIQ